MIVLGDGGWPNETTSNKKCKPFNTYSVNGLIFSITTFCMLDDEFYKSLLDRNFCLLPWFNRLIISHWKPPLRVGLKRKCLINYLKIAKFRCRGNLHFRKNVKTAFAKVSRKCENKHFRFNPIWEYLSVSGYLLWCDNLSVCRFWCCTLCKCSQIPAQ